jgi:hypothetical protein
VERDDVVFGRERRELVGDRLGGVRSALVADRLEDRLGVVFAVGIVVEIRDDRALGVLCRPVVRVEQRALGRHRRSRPESGS